MSTISDQFGFIGWCNEDNHDKIWGYFFRPTPEYDDNNYSRRWVERNVCIFWAARGKAMQFKADTTGMKLETTVRSKLKKGYSKITADNLVEIWPSFIEEAEAKLMWDVLAGKVK